MDHAHTFCSFLRNLVFHSWYLQICHQQMHIWFWLLGKETANNFFDMILFAAVCMKLILSLNMYNWTNIGADLQISIINLYCNSFLFPLLKENTYIICMKINWEKEKLKMLPNLILLEVAGKRVNAMLVQNVQNLGNLSDIRYLPLAVKTS